MHACDNIGGWKGRTVLVSACISKTETCVCVLQVAGGGGWGILNRKNSGD